MSEAFLKYIQENNIQPAEFENKNSELGIILSLGNTFEHLFDKLGLKINQDP